MFAPAPHGDHQHYTFGLHDLTVDATYILLLIVSLLLLLVVIITKY